MAVKKITIDYNEKKYTLEYTKDSVRLLERRGFVVDDVTSSPMTSIPLLFAGAFLANHRHLPQAVIDDIYESIPEVMDLIPKLIEMYNEPIVELMGLGEGADKGKKAKWEATF